MFYIFYDIINTIPHGLFLFYSWCRPIRDDEWLQLNNNYFLFLRLSFYILQYSEFLIICYGIINSMPSRGLFVLFYSVWTPDAKNHKARACDPLLIVNNKGLKYSHNCTVIIIKGSTRGSFDFFGSVWTPDVKNHKKRRGRSHWNNY